MENQNIYSKAEGIRDVLRYIQRFKEAVVVMYIDDRVIESNLFQSHIRDICKIHEAGLQVIIVPGARKRIDEVLSQEGLSWAFEEGYRITGQEAIPLIKMAAFDVSNRIMTSLAGEKKTAVIGNWVKAKGKGIRNGIDFSTAGEIDKIQEDSIKTVLENKFIPIFPCIGWSAAGKPYNISSLELAAEIAQLLKADKLFFLLPEAEITAKDYKLPQDITLSPEGRIPALNLEEAKLFLKENPLTNNSCDSVYDKKAMVLKLIEIGISSCSKDVSRVHILNSLIDGTIPCEIFSDFGCGTMIYKSNYGGIRSMTTDDIPAVMNLIRPFVEQEILLPRTEESFTTTYKDYIVYELDGGIRACAALHFYDNNQAEIAAVAVEPNYSHIGVGIKLVNYLLSKAKEKNISSVFILTTQTADWFESLGFKSDSIETMPEERRSRWSAKRGSKLFRKSLC